MARNARRCIFCGASANSKEHLWPVWLHEHLGPVEAGVRHDRQVYNYHPSTGEEISGPTGRQGDQRTIRVRAVCRACNSGWMNRIEADARPHLTSIVRGDPVTLSASAVEAVAKWVTLKAIVAEHTAPDVALTPQSDRSAFANEGTIPAYFRIYVAHNISDRRLYYLRHSHCIWLSGDAPAPPLKGMTKNIQTITIVAGRAIIHVTSARIDDFAMEERVKVLGFHDRCCIWPPPPSPVSFPARPNLNLEGINFVAMSLDRYIGGSNATWLNRPIA